MFKISSKIRSNTSTLISLYALGTFALFFYFMIAVITLVHCFQSLEDISRIDFNSLIFWNILNLMGLLLVSLPFAIAISVYLLANKNQKDFPYFRYIYDFIYRMPILLWSLFFVLIFNTTMLAYLSIVFILAVTKLVHRWVGQSKNVSELDVQTAKSLGLNDWQIVYWLYIQKNMGSYILHALAVLCFLATIISPYLILNSELKLEENILSLNLYKAIETSDGVISYLFVFILCLHLFKRFLDSSINFVEVENG